MGVGKIIFLILFFLISIPLIIITLISTKDDTGVSSAIIGETMGNDSIYGKKKSKEDKMDLVIKILFGAFVIVIIVGYFI